MEGERESVRGRDRKKGESIITENKRGIHFGPVLRHMCNSACRTGPRWRGGGPNSINVRNEGDKEVGEVWGGRGGGGGGGLQLRDVQNDLELTKCKFSRRLHFFSFSSPFLNVICFRVITSLMRNLST